MLRTNLIKLCKVTQFGIQSVFYFSQGHAPIVPITLGGKAAELLKPKNSRLA